MRIAHQGYADMDRPGIKQCAVAKDGERKESTCLCRQLRRVVVTCSLARFLRARIPVQRWDDPCTELARPQCVDASHGRESRIGRGYGVFLFAMSQGIATNEVDLGPSFAQSLMRSCRRRMCRKNKLTPCASREFWVSIVLLSVCFLH